METAVEDVAVAEGWMRLRKCLRPCRLKLPCNNVSWLLQAWRAEPSHLKATTGGRNLQASPLSSDAMTMMALD